MSNQPRRTKPSMRAAAVAKAQAQARARARRRRAAAVAGGVVAFLVVAVALYALVRPTHKDVAVAPSPDAVKLGCASCHTTDGNRSEGPTWKGLYGSKVTLTDGRTVLADDAYLRRSILDPQADIASGGTGSMPTLPVTRAELNRLVAYIRSLRS